MKDIAIETLHRDGVADLLGWAAEEGWNPGLADADVFYHSDPSGFLLLRAAGQPAAGISVVRQNDDFGFLGLYMAAPQFRGQGYAWKLWQAGIEHLNGTVTGLDGVVDQQANYRRSGFAFLHRTIRYAGTRPLAGSFRDGTGRSTAAAPGSDAHDAAVDGDIRAYRTGDLAGCVTLDAAVGGLERPSFLRLWFEEVPSLLPAEGALRLTQVLTDRHGDISGLGTIRRCGGPHKVGPLLAADAGAAARLLDSLLAASQASSFTLDIPETNPAAARLCSQCALLPVFETARMYRGPAPAIDTTRLFAVASLELG